MANTSKKSSKVSSVVEEVISEPVSERVVVDTTSVIDSINHSVDKVSSNETVSSKSFVQEVSIPNEEEIAVRSICFGGLTWISPRTNAHYRWNEIGSVEYIPFGELVTLNNTKRTFLFDPLVILQDERAVKYFRLEQTYEKVSRINNLEEVFATNNLTLVEDTLNTIMSVNMRDVAISRIRSLRQNGTLTNIDVIRMIERILCFDLTNEI